MSVDIRDELEPLDDHTVADTTARQITVALLDQILRAGGAVEPQKAARIALQIDRLLRPLTDEQQALGQALAAFPSQYRAARRAGQP